MIGQVMFWGSVAVSVTIGLMCAVEIAHAAAELFGSA